MVGTYCPVGYDTDRSGMVYLKAHRVLLGRGVKMCRVTA